MGPTSSLQHLLAYHFCASCFSKQLNGAELCEGVVLQVQPAGSPSPNILGTAPAASAAATTTANEDSAEAVDEDEDLDSFFDSLE